MGAMSYPTCGIADCTNQAIGCLIRQDDRGTTLIFECDTHAEDHPTRYAKPVVAGGRRHWGSVHWEPRPERATA